MILVTGGAGFIGANFVLDWLAASDEPVVNLDKLTYAGNLENLKSVLHDPRHIFVRGDIADRALAAGLLKRYQPRALVHFAAESHVDRSISGPEAFIHSNIEGTFSLLEASRAYWAALPEEGQKRFRFHHVGTDEVYGSLKPDEAPFSERHPYAPNSPYSASKAASDHLARAWHRTYGLPVLVSHCSNNYGFFQFPEKLIPLLIARALSGQALPIYGDGLQVRDWLYAGDHCAAIRRILEAGIPGECYNIGGESEKTNLEIVRHICGLLDTLCPRADSISYTTQICHVTDRPGHDRRYAIDAQKLEKELGWRPKETFESGIEKTVRWYLENRGWLENVQSGAYKKQAEPD